MLLIKKKVDSKLSLWKRLAGCKWCCNRDSLIIIYEMYKNSVLAYCNGVLVLASDSTIDKLQKIPNQAMLLLTETIMSTPTVQAW